MLQSTGWQRVGQDLVTEQQQHVSIAFRQAPQAGLRWAPASFTCPSCQSAWWCHLPDSQQVFKAAGSHQAVNCPGEMESNTGPEKVNHTSGSSSDTLKTWTHTAWSTLTRVYRTRNVPFRDLTPVVWKSSTYCAPAVCQVLDFVELDLPSNPVRSGPVSSLIKRRPRLGGPRLEKALKSPLDSKEIKPFNPKGNQP